jgi:glutathione S-transferase
MYQLYIANKNYSSWSLRPWLLMKQLGIAFQEHLIPFHDTKTWDAYRRISPSGKVPCLIDGENVVWDSLAIVEYLAERRPDVWPADAAARAWARSAAAEMHSGFAELRGRCSMSCGIRVKLNEFTPALKRDLDRIATLWNQGLLRFGGPFLAGKAFSAVDAFFGPVAFRIQTYGLTLDPVADAYAKRLLELELMQEWYAAGLSEAFRDEPHDMEILEAGTVTQDLRALP